MSKKNVYILNINTYTIGLEAIEFLCDGYFRKYKKEVVYNGIKNNFFVNPDVMSNKIEQLINDCSDFIEKTIEKIYITLPQKFFRTKHNNVAIKIRDDVPVNKFDVENVLRKSIVEIEDSDFIDCIPIAYKTAEDYIDNPIGQETTSLEALTVTVGVLSRIKEFFDDMAKRFNVELHIVPQTTPALNKLQNELKTNRSPRILIMIHQGFIDVCYCEMKAVIAHKSIDWGEEHFVEAVADICKTNYTESTALLRHINLNVEENDEYAIFVDKQKVFDVITVNKRIIDLLKFICSEIKLAIISMTGDCLLPIFMTGSSILEIKGFNELVKKELGTQVEILKPDTLNWKSPNEYAELGLIEILNIN